MTHGRDHSWTKMQQAYVALLFILLALVLKGWVDQLTGLSENQMTFILIIR